MNIGMRRNRKEWGKLDIGLGKFGVIRRKWDRFRKVGRDYKHLGLVWEI